MDNGGIDPALYDPLSLLGTTGATSSGGPNQNVPSQPIVAPTGTIGPAPVTPELSNANILGNLSSNLGDIIPGLRQIVSLIGIVESVIGDIAKDVSEAKALHPLGIIEAVAKNIGGALTVFDLANVNFANWMSQHQVGNPFSDFLSTAIGADVSKFTDEENKAVQGVDRMLGFALGLQLLSAAVSAVGEGFFANRWGKGIHEALRDIPNELGLSWVLGLTIEESFKAAQGAILIEAMNKQFHPNRIEWPQIRVLLKQHAIDETTFMDLMNAQGFTAEQAGYLAKLQDVQIPIGDIAQLWYRNELGDDDALTRIKALGFNDVDASLLFNLYVKKSENEASVTYRSIARQLYENDFITQNQYVAALQHANFPQNLIDEDVAAVNLVRDSGRVRESVAIIKQRYQHNTINADEVTKELKELHYSDASIPLLIEAWSLPPLRRTHGLSQAKILSYMISGLIDPGDALTKLLQTGLDQQDAQFLIAHPTANAGARRHARTPSLVIQAYLDGAITLTELPDALRSANVSDADLPWWESIAKYRYAHRKHAVSGTLQLTVADIKEAYRYGLMAQDVAIGALENFGYSPEDALLLIEIVNKGPIPLGPPGPPLTVQEAEAFLSTLGYTFLPPPDPRIAQSIAVLEGAGITPIPAGTQGRPPPPGPIPSPGPSPVGP